MARKMLRNVEKRGVHTARNGQACMGAISKGEIQGESTRDVRMLGNMGILDVSWNENVRLCDLIAIQREGIRRS